MRKFLSLVMMLFASLSLTWAAPQAETQTVYLNSGGNTLWGAAEAVFFVHSWGGAEAYATQMSHVDGDLYKADIPADNTSLLFVRMPKGSKAIDWDNLWNKTADMTLKDGKNLYTITGWGGDDKISSGSWSKYEATGGEDPGTGEEPPTPGETVTLYFVNAEGWEAVNAYVWGGKEATAKWPGTAMTKTELKANEKDVYSITFAADNDSIIFNDGNGNQTTNKEAQWAAAKPYYCDGKWYAELKDIPSGEEPPTPADQVTLYFVNVPGWSSVNAHIWGGEGATKWPGLAMVKTDKKACDKDVYSITFASDNDSIIFNNGDGVQTLNEVAEWAAAKPYFYDNVWYASLDEIKCPESPIQECKDGPYGLIFNGKDTIEAKPFAEADHEGRKQYQADSVVVKAGDKIVVANLSCDAKWVMPVEESGAYADFDKDENEYTAKKDGMFVFFIKMKENDDVMYIGEIVDEPSTPTENITLYFVNVPDWSSVNAHIWGGEGATKWPGLAMVKTDKKACDKDVYSITFASDNDSIIFNNGDGAQTSNEVAEWAAAKPYFYDNVWYASLDEIKCPESPIQECKDGPYGLIFNGKDTIEAKPYAEADHEGRKQYQADSVVVKAGDKIVVANLSCDAKWVMPVEESGAYADFDKDENEYTAKKDGMFVFFIKMKENDDVMYIGEIVDEPSTPTENITLYFVNVPDWSSVNAHIWGGKDRTEWPGNAMVKTDKKACDKDVYSITFASDNDSIIFNNGDGVQTSNEVAEWAAAKPYFYDNVWYASLDEIKCPEPPTQECKDGPYGLIFNGKDTIEAKPFAEADHEGRKQYQADSVVVKAGDKIVVANLSCDAKWVMPVEESGAYADFDKDENEYTAKKDGMFVFFIKMKENDDVMYIGEIVDEPSTPTENITLYFVNVPDWSSVNAHIWGGEGATKWPGNAMVKTDKKACDKDVYSITFASDNDSIIFNGDGVQTSNEVAEWAAAKPYFYDNVWYASLDEIKCPEPPTPGEDVYTVAGIPAVLFGTEWDENNPDNILVYNGKAAYEWEKKNVVLPSGQIEFKIVKNHDWDTSWPVAGNYFSNNLTAGVYDVHIAFYPATNHIEIIPDRKGDYVPEVPDGFYLVGTMNEWKGNAAYEFQKNDGAEGDEYSLKTTLSVGDSFKVAYVENDDNKTWYPAEADNYVVDAEHAGKVTIYFRPDYSGADDWYYKAFYVAVDAPTGLNTVAAGKVVKVLRNGQLLIERNGVFFNAQGAVVR